MSEYLRGILVGLGIALYNDYDGQTYRTTLEVMNDIAFKWDGLSEFLKKEIAGELVFLD